MLPRRVRTSVAGCCKPGSTSALGGALLSMLRRPRTDHAEALVGRSLSGDHRADLRWRSRTDESVRIERQSYLAAWTREAALPVASVT
jgi:hypothetical protein